MQDAYLPRGLERRQHRPAQIYILSLRDYATVYSSLETRKEIFVEASHTGNRSKITENAK